MKYIFVAWLIGCLIAVGTYATSDPIIERTPISGAGETAVGNLPLYTKPEYDIRVKDQYVFDENGVGRYDAWEITLTGEPIEVFKATQQELRNYRLEN